MALFDFSNFDTSGPGGLLGQLTSALPFIDQLREAARARDAQTNGQAAGPMLSGGPSMGDLSLAMPAGNPFGAQPGLSGGPSLSDLMLRMPQSGFPGAAPTDVSAAVQPRAPQPIMPPQQPQQAPAPSDPFGGGVGFGDRLMAGFQGFMHSSSPLSAIGDLVGGLATGQRSDPQGMQLANQRAIYTALAPKFGAEAALIAALNPAAAAELIKPSTLSPGQVLASAGTGPMVAVPQNPVSLSEGQQLTNPVTGRIIASAPYKPVAVQQGGQLMNPNNGQVIGSNNTGTLEADTMTQMADQAIAGDTSVLQNNGRNGVNTTALRNRIAQRMQERGVSPEQMAANVAAFQGQKSTERALGTRVATVEMPVVEAQNLAPQVLETSAKVSRTQYPALNSIILAGERNTGDPNVVRLGIAVNSLINVYARAINPTGASTVSDKDHARALLSDAWSKGQIEAGVDQLMKELSIARQSPGIVQQDVRSRFVGNNGGPASTGSQSAPASPLDIGSSTTINGVTIRRVK